MRNHSWLSQGVSQEAVSHPCRLGDWLGWYKASTKSSEDMTTHTPSSQFEFPDLFVDIAELTWALSSDTKDKISMMDKLENIEAEAVTVFTDKDSSSDSLDKPACKFSSVGHAYPSS